MTLNIEEKRYLAIDNFRGIVLIFLAWYMFFVLFANVPVVLKHALTSPGLYLADIGAPCFMLALSLSAVIVFSRGKQKEGLGKTTAKFVKRYFLIIGIGFTIMALQFTLFGFFGGEYSMETFSPYVLFPSNVLICFGMSGLLSLCFFNMNKWWRLFFGAALIVMHNFFLLDTLFLHYVDSVDFGGVMSILSWCGYLLLTSFLAEQYFTGKKHFYITVGAAAVTAIAFTLAFFFVKSDGGNILLFFALSKVRATTGYMFVNFGIAAAIFAMTDLLTDNRQIPFVTTIGQNTIVFFIYASAMGMGLSALLSARRDIAGPLELLVYGAVVFALMAAPAWVFHKMKLKVAA